MKRRQFLKALGVIAIAPRVLFNPIKHIIGIGNGNCTMFKLPTGTISNDTTRLTLAEMAKRHVGDKSEAAIIAEILNKDNPILQDAPWREANATFSHEVVRRGSLPTGTKRRINSGVPNEVSRTGKVREGMIWIRMEIYRFFLI